MSKAKNNIEHIRHSLSHLMTMAVQELYPQVGLGVGPAIENGFYQDYDLPEPISPDILPKLEKRMRELIAEKIKFVQHFVDFDKAYDFYKNDPYKTAFIDDLKAAGEKKVSFYRSGWFDNLCAGPHVKNTGEINPEAFVLTRLAGAYWRGDEKNPMLTRVYGLAFATKKELDTHLTLVEEAKKRDHRKLGRQLDLFTFSQLVGSGLPLYTPKGAFIRRALSDYVESLQSKAGYEQVWTPQIAKAELFKTSGHYDKYKDSMFHMVSNYSKEELYLKPMNCPQHTQIYASQPRSYRDLPLRYTDFAMLYRDEKPGELNGLARVRSFSQDDCHVFCREDQVDEEVDKMLAMTKEVMETFGLKYRYRLSTRDKKHPEKYVGDAKTWKKVEAWAEKIMKRNKIAYFDGPGEATFYAPKMDLMATDALGREWQLSTVQIDFFTPERFGLTYVDRDGKEKCPVMIHRAIIGSPERFIMILLEHYAGALPLWLSPVQVRVLAISEKHAAYAARVARELRNQDVRTELGEAQSTLGKRIRGAELAKIPYILVVGDQETKAGTVNVRERHREGTSTVPLERFIETLLKRNAEKR